MPNTHEQKFLNALRDIFVGAKIEGESGYINLMRIKSRYYTEGVFPKLMEKIDEEIKDFPAFREELFDKLFTFFKRYFSESGSIYFRHTPYYQDIYERIYTDDRDVMLFWKTQNLYYVKTDRLFRSLTIALDDAPDQKYLFDATKVAKQTFDFDASTLQNKRNNEKRNLVFSYEGIGEKEMLKFSVDYSKGATKTKVDDILKAIKKDGVRVNEDQLTRAFSLFERQSEVDFFINKNAKAFLNEQFDLWMYQYLFKNDSTDWTDKRIKQMQALKRVAYAIIEFIAQFEDELVRIWNKPKFALSSNYVITFDRVYEKSEVTARKLLAHEGMTAQIEEWQTLGIIDDDFTPEKIFEVEEINGDLPFEDEVANDVLNALNPKLCFLPFDTKHFKSLEIEILSLFENLDEELDGRLIHSENYQALNTLKDKFREKVKTIYIDPPYNTATSEIIYTNTYKHSSWATLIDNRLEIGKYFLDTEKGVICCAIDDVEQKSLSYILENHFGELAGTVSIRTKPSGKPIPNGFALSHEYALFARINSDYPVARIQHTEEQKNRYRETDHKGRFFWEMLRKAGSGSNREDRPTMYFPFYLNKNNGKIRLPEMIFDEITQSYITEDKTKRNEIEIFPVKDDGSEGRWYFGYETAKTVVDEIKAELQSNNQYFLYYRRRPNEGLQPTTLWLEPKYSATEHGTALLKNLFGEQEAFSYPKSIYAVEDCLKVSGASKENQAFYLDFFAGSGTTAHAVINFNRDDKYTLKQKDFGRRKYILVEANDYFHTVILPRVKKVVFSDKWKNGKAQPDGKGVSHFCKYFALEQYEDTLRRAVYVNDSEMDAPSFFDNPFESPFSSYVFLRDKKMSDALKVDYEADKITVDFAKLYPEIDWAETLSCIKGKFIKSITAESVTFEVGETVKFAEMDYRDILPLIWWDKS